MAVQTIVGGGAFTAKNISTLNTNFNIVSGLAAGNPFGDSRYVDGDTGDDDTGTVNTPTSPYLTIQAAINDSAAGDRVYVKPRAMAAGATDPANYAETVTIPAGKSGLWLIGIGGPAQGNQPQIKKGSGSTALLTVRSPGCVITGLSFNGASSTGGGILLDDDGSTKTAFGTIIAGCFFKNCKGHATNGALGGAIAWTANGGAWQVRIEGNRFYANVCSICLVGTSNDRPKDVVITGNKFGADAATAVDAYIYGAGGSGFNDVEVSHNTFDTVLPNNTSGTIHRYIDLTGVAAGVVADCRFGSNGGTYGAAGDSAKIPTTVGISGNYQDGALIART